MRWLRLAFSTILFSLVFLALIPFVFGHNIYYDPSAHMDSPFTIPDYGTWIDFSTPQVFDTYYRENSYCYFRKSTTSLVGFQVQNANLTITDFFASDSNKLIFDAEAPSGTSTTKVYCGDRGKPVEITPSTADSGYSATTKIQTLTWTHSSNQEITLRWSPHDPYTVDIWYVLTVAVLRENGTTATGVPVIVTLEGEEAGSSITDAWGEARFNLGWGEYLVQAGTGNETASTTVMLDSDRKVTLILESLTQLLPPIDIPIDIIEIINRCLLFFAAAIIIVAIWWLRKPQRRRR